jgi:hypothetical protein
VKGAVRRADQVAAGVLPAAAFVRLGIPALAAAVSLVVLVAGVTCWVLSSDDRSDRLNRMLLARQGDARCLKPGRYGAAGKTPPTKGQLSEVTGRYL